MSRQRTLSAVSTARFNLERAEQALREELVRLKRDGASTDMGTDRERVAQLLGTIQHALGGAEHVEAALCGEVHGPRHLTGHV